jgi:1-deoxy-D-xylulose-5-phosphate synthase
VPQHADTALTLNGPSAVRYPRGSGPGTAVEPGLATLPVGKGELRRQGKRVALLAFGAMLAPALKAAETLDATVANMRFVKPLDAGLIAQLAGSHDLLVSIEENALIGGAGSEVARALESTAGSHTPVAAPWPARPFHRPWRFQPCCWLKLVWTTPASCKA